MRLRRTISLPMGRSGSGAGIRWSAGLDVPASCFKMFLQHLPTVPNWKISSLLLPRPNLSLGSPPRVLVQLLVRVHIWTVDHIEIPDVQGALLKDVKKLQAAPTVVAGRHAQV